MKYDCDFMATHRAKRRSLTCSSGINVVDDDKSAFAEVEEYFNKFFEIGEKKKTNFTYSASMILLFLDEEHRKDFL